ncbi:MAG: class I SAM-dependent RNA methyltransferase [bacterium]|nr:class I SAM-dependent RNA methyltransferase [bacterium]
MTHTIEITAVAHGGHGIGRIEGRVCFVPFALPGDTVRVVIEREEKRMLWGRIEEVVEPSPDRIETERPITEACDGSVWLHFGYPAQAEWKHRIVKDCFERIAKVETDPAWVEDPDLRFGYRTRAKFHSDGERWGFFFPGTHRIVEEEHYPLCHPRLNEALAKLRTTGYKGAVEVVVNPEGEETLVWTKRPYRKIKNAFPLAGSPDDKGKPASFLFDGIPIVCGAFSQSSLLLNRKLVPVVHDFVGNASAVLDLYCGSGNLSLGLKGATRVLGLDQTRSAVRAAERMRRGEYRRRSERGFLNAIEAEHWDVVVMDPPRIGAKEIIRGIGQTGAKAIIYVSCDPATLARDAATLMQCGWHVDRVTAIDMFPHTAHVETVCRFGR